MLWDVAAARALSGGLDSGTRVVVHIWRLVFLFVAWSCWNELPSTQWPKAIEMSVFPAFQAGSLPSGRRATFSPKVPEILGPSGFRRLPADRGTPGPVDVSLRPLSPSSHDLPGSLLLALSSPETSLPCSSATSSRLTTSAKTPFLMESPSQVPGLRTSMEFFTGHNLSQKTILPGLIIRKK